MCKLEDGMKNLIEKYPTVFTGETILIPDPTPEQQAADMALMEELKRLTAPLVEWLRVNYGSYASIHICWDRVDIEQHIMGVPFPYSGK